MRYYLIVKTEYLDEKNLKYNEVISKINSLGRVINLNPETMRKSVDGTLGIIEVHNLEDNINKSKIDTMIKTPYSFYEEGDIYTERAIVEEKLEELKNKKIIVAYGHYPHLSDGKQACIHCYLKSNEKLWQPKEEEIKNEN